MDTTNKLVITLTSNYRYDGKSIREIEDAIKSVTGSSSGIQYDVQNWDRFKVERTEVNPGDGSGFYFNIIDTVNDSVFKEKLTSADAERLTVLLNNNFNNVSSFVRK